LVANLLSWLLDHHS